MISDAGMLVSISPRNCSDSGSVASDLSAASSYPTSAEMVTISEVLLIISAWQAESR